MKFGQKVFGAVLMLFCVGIAVVSGTVLTRSDTLIREAAMTSSQVDISVIEKSICDRLRPAAKYYRTFNAENIKFFLKPYDVYYSKQGMFFMMYAGDQLIYSSCPTSPPQQAYTEGEARFTEWEDRLFLTVRRGLAAPPDMPTHENDPDGLLQSLSVVFMKDVSYIRTLHEQTRRVALLICLLTTGALAALLSLLILQLTRPIRELSRAAEQIAAGDYSGRVRIYANDEIGNFSRTFNSMAQSVGGHVNLLQSLTDERQRFINHMTHELRTPITAIVGYGEYLQNYDAPQDKRALAVHYIVEQGKRLQNLSEKLLLLIHTEQRAPSFGDINIAEVVASVCHTLAPKLQERGITLHTALNADILYGDRDLIEMLIQNLLENAVNASPRGEAVQLRAYRQDGFVMLEISDSGPGIPEQEREKVLEPFYRVKRPQADAPKGLGLGLALCKQICDLHGAKMVITAAEGAGTTVNVQLTTSS